MSRKTVAPRTEPDPKRWREIARGYPDGHPQRILIEQQAEEMEKKLAAK